MACTTAQYNSLVKLHKKAADYSHLTADVRCKEIIKLCKQGKTTIKDQLAYFNQNFKKSFLAFLEPF